MNIRRRNMSDKEKNIENEKQKPENLKRLTEIIEILKKYDLIKGGLSPVKLRSILEDLGPTFIKLGQIMSMRTDFLPAEYCSELENLRTNVKELQFEEVKKVIETECSDTLENLFEYIDEKPVGSASIAQVHTAILKNSGKKVVIKVQRPGIKEVMAQDISLIRKAVKMLKIIPVSDNINISDVIEEMWVISQEELDFMIEAGHINEFYENCRDVEGVSCPAVESNMTNSKILVMDFVDGYSVGENEKIDADNLDRKKLASTLTENYMKQVLDDGFFHADPHPGNIKIQNGEIFWIDMGMMGRLSQKDRKLFKKAVKAVVKNDIDDVISVIVSLGACKGNINYSKLYEDVENILKKYLESDMGDIDLAAMLNDMLALMKDHNITIPKGLSMLARGVLTIQGVIAGLYPELNIIEIAKNKILADTISEFDITKEIENKFAAMFGSGTKAVELPGTANDLMKATLKGHTKLNLDLTGSEAILNKISKLISRLVMGLISASLIIGSSTLCTSEGTPKVFGISLGYLGFAVAAVLGVKIIIDAKRK